MSRENYWYPPAYQKDKDSYTKLKDKVNGKRKKEGKPSLNHAEFINALVSVGGIYREDLINF